MSGQEEASLTNVNDQVTVNAAGALVTSLNSGQTIFTSTLPGVDWGAQLVSCATSLGSTGGTCNMAGTTTGLTLTANYTITQSNLLIIFPPNSTLSHGNNFTINVNGSHVTGWCQQTWSCTIDGATKIGSFID